MRGPSDGELIGGTLVLVDRATDDTSKLRLGLLLDENTERNFCLSHFLGGRSLFGGVDIVRGRVWICYRWIVFAYIILSTDKVTLCSLKDL
jgi:hypothetical protein